MRDCKNPVCLPARLYYFHRQVGSKNGFPREKVVSPDSSSQAGDRRRRHTDFPFLPLASPDCASHHCRFRAANPCLRRDDDVAAQTRKNEKLSIRQLHFKVHDIDYRSYSTPKSYPNGLGSMDPHPLVDRPWVPHSFVRMVQWSNSPPTWLKRGALLFSEWW